MRYVQINAYANGWADSIVFKKHRELQAQGEESYVFWARGSHDRDERMIKIATYPEVCFDAFLTRLDGRAGFHSKGITKRLLRKLDEIDPDVVHLHILLGYYLNVEMLFDWLANHRCRVIWTLHDCWAFTGHCVYFTYAKCDQWKTHCGSLEPCSQTGAYPETICKKSVFRNFEQKKRLFTMLPSKRMKLLTPSRWLADLVKLSFLKKYEIEVVHNTVNVDVFKPTSSDFRERYGVGDRFMVLGVAAKWSERKGLSDFVKLARILDKNKYAVVVVGLSKKQIKQIKGELIALPRTENMEELAGIYTTSDVLINPSSEETYGMNVAEAAACGTRSIVIRGSACAEVAEGATFVSPDLSDLAPTIVKMQRGGVVILLPKTGNLQQLAAVYSAADVFFNPTREENYPTVNLEAQACGTTVVTYDVGGCGETLDTEMGSLSVPLGDIESFLRILP